MTKSSIFWVPEGNLSEGQALALSVSSPAKPRPEVFSSLLEQKLQTLIDQMPRREAQDVMEGSPVQLPEVYLIAKNQTPNHWAISLANSDSMHSLANQIDWSLPGSLQKLPQQDLQSLLEQLS